MGLRWREDSWVLADLVDSVLAERRERHGRLTNSPARTNQALLIRRAVRLSEEGSLDAPSRSQLGHPNEGEKNKTLGGAPVQPHPIRPT
jgi:hypothetical protein